MAAEHSLIVPANALEWLIESILLKTVLIDLDCLRCSNSALYGVWNKEEKCFIKGRTLRRCPMDFEYDFEFVDSHDDDLDELTEELINELLQNDSLGG